MKSLLHKYWFYLILLGLSGIYLILQYDQYYNVMSWADTDDTLQYTLSRYITNGEWLGPYNRLTLIKGIGFPLWTAALHTLHIPLWLGNSSLLIAACAAVTYALSRLGLSRWMLVTVYALLLFNPMISARIYRDQIIPALFLFVCAWAIGIFACLSQRNLKKKYWTDICVFTVIGSFGLPMWYYTREDPLWVAPFIVFTIGLGVLCFAYSVRSRLAKSTKTLLGVSFLVFLPLALTHITGIAIAKQNNKYYGRYVINDYFSDEFSGAYQALNRVNYEQTKPVSVPVTHEMRQKLYKASPAFKELEPCLDDPMGTCTGFKSSGPNKHLNDYEGGWFPFAMRLAVEQAGYYSSASKAESYYKQLINEVNVACDNGKLQCHPGSMYSLMPLPTKPILEKFWPNIIVSSKFISTLYYSGENYSPIGQERTLDKDAIAQYYDARYTTPTLGVLGQNRLRIFSYIHRFYSVASPILLLTGLISLITASFAAAKRRSIIDWKVLVVAWLLLATLAARLAILTYVQTVSFPTIYPVYYAAVYPLLFLLEGVMLSISVACIQHYWRADYSSHRHRKQKSATKA